jgi:putative N-acetyltransferase (TIGR04045 family)
MSIMEVPVRPRLSVRIKQAVSQAERDATRRLRRAVFCEEQGLFNGDDLDATDAVALPLAAIIGADGAPGEVVGTVRIHQAEGRIWWGSRLAVSRPYRRQADIGTGLIKLAVGMAHARGCRTFLAYVQAQNVMMFEQLHWLALYEIEVHGRPHYLMRADLSYYPPILDGESGFLSTREEA